MRLTWMTDIHLNFVEPPEFRALVGAVKAKKPDRVLICGDIGEAPSVCDYVADFATALDLPIFFVLGNHDFYGGSIAHVRADIEQLASRIDNLTYLTDSGVIELTPTTGLIGHDGWADARLGDYDNSGVILNDYLEITELRARNRNGRKALRPKEELRTILQRLAGEAADHLGEQLRKALETHTSVVAITHVPPFRDACRYRGRTSDEDFLPHYSSKVTGDVMSEIMQANPDKQLTVLCGHTHSAGRVEILPNLKVVIGGSEYGAPKVQRSFTVD
jgi:predicted MPP superfamily phosphohydrolase